MYCIDSINFGVDEWIWIGKSLNNDDVSSFGPVWSWCLLLSVRWGSREEDFGKDSGVNSVVG